MSTEYRRGIPSAAHVEAASRLGLEWEETRWTRSESRRWRFEMRDGELWCDFMGDVSGWGELETLSGGRIADRVDVERYSFRPIHTDGTPVDWEVLDAEVARAQRGEVSGPLVACNLTAAETPEPRSFADVRPDRHGWRWWQAQPAPRNDALHNVSEVHRRIYVQDGAYRWVHWTDTGLHSFLPENWLDRTVIPTDEQGNPVSWDSIGQPAGAQPQGFRADLWRQMCQNFIAADVGRLRFQDITELRENVFHFAAGYVQYLTDDTRPGFTRADILARWAIYQELKPLYDIVDGAQGEATMPRDVEAEWHLQATTEHDRRAEGGRFGRDTKGVYLQCRSRMTWRSDEDVYGVPLRNFTAVLDAVAEQRVVARGQPAIRVSPAQLEYARRDSESVYQRILEAANAAIAQVVMSQPHAVEIDGDATYVNLQPSLLPRFTADELNDVDHSATTTQDNATLKRGKLPTVESIGKYREVMARRNGSIAEAAKASGIDCEVAQYVLERWAGGLSDDLCLWLLRAVGKYCHPGQQFTQRRVDELARQELADRPTLDTSEPIDTEAQRQRAETKERQAHMAAVQAQLAKERAARIAEPLEEPTRFSLLEVDEAADPARSIEAWKTQRESLARHAQRKAIEYANRPPPPPPMPAPKRKPFEVVDAQADGLSGSAALAVLLGRAMNAEC